MSACSQWPLAQSNPYAKEVYFGVMHSGTLRRQTLQKSNATLLWFELYFPREEERPRTWDGNLIWKRAFTEVIKLK